MRQDLDGRIDMILDGGPVGIGLESTIVDLTEGTPTHSWRPGYITGKMLREVLGEVRVDPGIQGKAEPCETEGAGNAVSPLRAESAADHRGWTSRKGLSNTSIARQRKQDSEGRKPEK